MRLLALVLATLVAMAGCGAAETTGGAPGSSTGATEDTEAPATSVDEPDDQRPPPFVLVSEAGRQVGVQSTYCVTGPTVGTCADYVDNGPPRKLSIVRPEETVQLAFEGAQSVDGDVRVFRLGCRKAIASIELAEPSTRWTVDLEPGSYELEVFALFETASTGGDTSASLGLLVDEAASLEIVPVPAEGAGCDRPQSR
jgi:hypothetical protein